MTDICRCTWPGDDELMLAYHDTEWGVPVYDDRKIFEYLILDGAQAGLSWKTILHKRENYRRAMDNFQPEIVATYDDARIAILLADAGIVRNRLKIHSAIRNAKVYLQIQQEYGTFSDYLWAFIDHTSIQNHFATLADIPASTPLSDQVSKDLKKRGMNFVGSTIIYAFMQGMGMVNDHITTCYRHAEVASLTKSS